MKEDKKYTGTATTVNTNVCLYDPVPSIIEQIKDYVDEMDREVYNKVKKILRKRNWVHGKSFWKRSW